MTKPCYCAMCTLDNVTRLPTEIKPDAQPFQALLFGVLVGAGVWVGFAVVWSLAHLVRHFGAGWFSLIAIASVGGLTALWFETTGRRR